MNHTLTPETIRFIRHVKNLTQQHLADLISVDQTLIGKIETSERSITPEIQRRLIETLDWQDPLLQDVIASVKRWREDGTGKKQEEIEA